MARKTAAPKVNTVDQVPDAHLQCRAISHNWYYSDAYREGKGFVQVLTCRECTSVRKDVLSNTGQYVSRSYSYAEGYIIPNASWTKADRGRIRLRSAGL